MAGETFLKTCKYVFTTHRTFRVHFKLRWNYAVSDRNGLKILFGTASF